MTQSTKRERKILKLLKDEVTTLRKLNQFTKEKMEEFKKEKDESGFDYYSVTESITSVKCDTVEALFYDIAALFPPKDKLTLEEK